MRVCVEVRQGLLKGINGGLFKELSGGVCERVSKDVHNCCGKVPKSASEVM